jgi:hypothetical protein
MGSLWISSSLLQLGTFGLDIAVHYCMLFTTSFFISCAEEYIALDDNKYIGDLLSEFKSAKDRNKGEILHCKLVFKKRLFRESDEAVPDPMFVQLSYVQVLLC